MVLAGVEAEMTPHFMCFAHTINLATQKAFKVDTVARLLGRVRKVVGFFHCSVRAAENLQEKQKQLALPPHKLIQDVSTWWNSSHDMFERFLEQHPAISAALMSRDLRKGEEVNTLKDKHFCDVEDIVKLMAPVKLVTTSMSEDKRPTLSMIPPVKAKLKKNFEASDEDSMVIREMKQAFRNDLQKCYTGLNHLFYTAAALDPCFKSLPFLSDHDAEKIFTSISAEATALHNKATGSKRVSVQTDPCQTEPADGDLDIRIDTPQTQDEPTVSPSVPHSSPQPSTLTWLSHSAPGLRISFVLCIILAQ